MEVVNPSMTVSRPDLVRDITIRYDPPRRGRVIPMAVHQDEAHDDIEDGGS